MGRGRKTAYNGVPQGWYPDAASPRIERFWNGQSWTEHTRPAAPVATVEPKSAFRRTQAERDKDRKFFKILVGGFGVLVLLSAVTQASSPEPPSPTSQAVSVDAESSEGEGMPDGPLALADSATPDDEAAAVDEIPAVEETVVAEEALPPLESFEAALEDNSDRVIDVFYNEELMFLRAEIYMETPLFFIDTGIYGEVTDVLKLVAESGLDVANFDFALHMELVDQLGNTEEEPVLRSSWSGETIDGINFPNFLRDNVLSIGEVVFMHPAIESELEG